MSTSPCFCPLLRRVSLVTGVISSIFIAVACFYLLFNLEQLLLVRKIFGDLSDLGSQHLKDYVQLAQWSAAFGVLGGLFAARRCCQKWCNPADHDPIFR